MSMCNCNQGRLPCTCKPAGGEVETVATMYVALLDDFQSFVCLGRPGDGTPIYKEEPLVRQSDHRAHVTRLQAEVERLKLLADKRWNDLTEESDKSSAEIYALKSELTKARELIGDMVKQQVEAGTDYTADVGRAKAYLSNQSAPADTCCGSCPAGCVVQAADKG